MRRIMALGAGLASLVVIAGCTGGTSQGSGGSGSDTITYLIGQPDTPAELTAIKQEVSLFGKQHPGKHVKLTVLPSDTERTVLQTQLQSGGGPDVFGYDTGPGFAGVLAKAGLLYNLNSAYQKYHWKIYGWARQRVTFGGKVVGIPDGIEQVGIFYNKDMFAKYHISKPQNLAQLEQDAASLKAHGIIPFAFSDKEGWEGGHLLSMTMSSMMGPSAMNALIAGNGAWNSPGVVTAISLSFSQFVKKGYLPKDPDAITYDNANALFYSGKAAMDPTGTWLIPDINSSMKSNVGFMPFPSPSGPGYFASGLGDGTFVSAQTKNPQLSLQFLDFMQQQQWGRWEIAKLDAIPAYPVDISGMKFTPLFRQSVADAGMVTSGTAKVGNNIDVRMTDTFNNAMWQGLQAVLTGSKTSQQAADAMQQAAKGGGS